MNDKDKEAFEKWLVSENKHEGVFSNNNNFTRDYWIAEKTWQAACEYKDKDLLEWKEAARSEANIVNVLQAENKKLRDALEYLNTITVLPEKVKPIIREALKELEGK
jgi:hypothetical protein